MKKVVSVVLVALMVLGLSVTAFAADGKVTVAADKTEAKAGETVVLTVKGEGLADAKALALVVTLGDKVALADAGKWLVEGSMIAAPIADGSAVWAADGAKAVNGDVYSFSVKLAEDAVPGKYTVGVKLVVGDEKVEYTETATIVVPEEVVAPCEHAWDEGKVTKEATTTEEGEKTYTCTKCQATKTEVLPKKANPSTGDNAVAVVFLSTLALVAACGVVVASKKRVND